MKSDRNLYLTNNQSIADNLVTLYRFNTPANINLYNTCYDLSFGSVKNDGTYYNFVEITLFPYNFTLVLHNTLTMNSYFTSANNKIRIRENYLYDNILYPDVSNDIFNLINLNIDRNVINMTISIPLILNGIMYNFNPNISMQQVYGDYRIKHNSGLASTLLLQAKGDILLYKLAINVLLSVILYQKYFDKTIFKQVNKVIPARCKLNKGIVYGNSDMLPIEIINVSSQNISVNNNINTNTKITSTINNLISNIDSTIKSVIATTSTINDISCNIFNMPNIYIYKQQVDTNIALSSFIQTINRHKLHNSSLADDIIKYNVNYTKLVINDPNKQINIDVI